MKTPLIKNNKKAQRKALLDRRRSLTKEQRALYSAAITEKIAASDEYKRAEICFLYASMPSEVQTKELILDALKAGKRVCLPYIASVENKIMEAAEIYSLEELTRGEYGILSVGKDKFRPVPPEDIDFILVPAAGFDREGWRMGMGGGYYDRYLERAKNACLVSGAYSCQITDEIARDEHDAQVEKIFTESEIIICRKGEGL